MPFPIPILVSFSPPCAVCPSQHLQHAGTAAAMAASCVPYRSVLTEPAAYRDLNCMPLLTGCWAGARVYRGQCVRAACGLQSMITSVRHLVFLPALLPPLNPQRGLCLRRAATVAHRIARRPGGAPTRIRRRPRGCHDAVPQHQLSLWLHHRRNGGGPARLPSSCAGKTWHQLGGWAGCSWGA